MKVLHVVGARPNYMKMAPIIAEMACAPEVFTQVLVHTGQHYDDNMSKVFFDDLAMPTPDEFLGIGSGTHADQTARTMLAFEVVLLKYKPDWVMVVGDVNSTLACALVSAKRGIPVAHVEAGLRSRDWSMPEEVNRVLTDRLSQRLFTPSHDADENLASEGIERERVYFVGNVMIDTLIKMLPRARESSIVRDLGLLPGKYVLVTLHRPANVDEPTALANILTALADMGTRFPVIFPMHPRTSARVAGLGLAKDQLNLHWLDPLGYLDFLALMSTAGAVITDSGGIQEETTFLGIPCLTLRPNTERPITIEVGTNRLVRPDRDALSAALDQAMRGGVRTARVPELWDGCSAQRIVDVMRRAQVSG